MKMGILAERNGMDDERLESELGIYMQEHGKVAEQDFRIWENKRYVASPKLVESEHLIAEHRKWAEQFYADAASD